MKFLKVILSLSLFASALALASGPSTPVSDGRGGIRCAAYDVKNEEHGNHGSCNSCLKDHPNCEMKCYSYDYTCKAKGTDERGQSVTFEASGSTEIDARERAIDRCYYSGAKNCAKESCSEDARLDERRRCN